MSRCRIRLILSGVFYDSPDSRRVSCVCREMRGRPTAEKAARRDREGGAAVRTRSSGQRAKGQTLDNNKTAPLNRAWSTRMNFNERGFVFGTVTTGLSRGQS